MDTPPAPAPAETPRTTAASRARHTSPADYLQRTESAVRHLFDGMQRYAGILARARPPIFVHGGGYGEHFDRAFAAWQSTNAQAIQAALQAERDYLEESFALDTLAGAVLQIAEKAFELYGTGTAVPMVLSGSVRPELARYFAGKEVRGVPMGAAIYAGRNQHAHYEEAPRKATAAILNVMATHGHPGIVDPALDPHNHGLFSMARNIVYLVGWENYAAYERDMRQALAV